MKVFVTGASGFIGSAVVRELIQAGHTVTGLARSNASADTLKRMGATPHAGSLTDLVSLRSAASRADGVIHLAFMHGLAQIPLRQRLSLFLGGAPTGIASRFMRVICEADRRAIDAMGAALQDSGRPLVTTFGTLGLTSPGKHWSAPASESLSPDPRSPGYGRAMIETTVEAWAERGVRASIIRLPPTVHGPDDAGLATHMANMARRKNVVSYLDEGLTRWPSVHRQDAARLYRIALENGCAGAHYHGVAEQGITFRELAETMAQRLKLPCQSRPTNEASKHFSWLASFVDLDNPTSAAQTQAELAWRPTQAGLLEEADWIG